MDGIRAQAHELSDCVDHHVADEVDSLPCHTFAEEVLLRFGRGSQQEVGELIGDKAVEFLRHRPVIRPQTSFNMSHLDPQLRGDQCGSDCRVHITIDHDPVRTTLEHGSFEADHDLRRLCRVRSGTDFEADIRPGDVELFEEDVRQIGVVVLPCVDESLANAGVLPQRTNDRGDFHEVGPGTDHVKKMLFHGSCYDGEVTVW